MATQTSRKDTVGAENYSILQVGKLNIPDLEESVRVEVHIHHDVVRLDVWQ
jgi:hypothetical protein